MDYNPFDAINAMKHSLIDQLVKCFEVFVALSTSLKRKINTKKVRAKL